jgi:predicted GNAT family N-acyltransferase
MSTPTNSRVSASSANQTLVAFVQVLTDDVYRAIVFGVIVSEAHRGQGLGLMLIQQVVSHPVLSQVECIQLFCLPDMLLPFYQKYGFEQAEQLLLVRQRQQADSYREDEDVI